MSASLLAASARTGGNAPLAPPMTLALVPDPDRDLQTLPIGAEGPGFAGLLGTDGRRYSLEDFADRQALVLIFSANRCPTAKAYATRLRSLQAEYGPRGVQLLVINSNDPALYPEESYRRMQDRAAADGFTFPYLLDEGQAMARAYGPTCTFHVFVLDRARRLAYEGRFDDARLPERVTTRDVAAALDAVLDGKPVPVPRTAAFGCSLDILPRAPSARIHRRLASLGPALVVAAVAAWLATIGAAMTGAGALLHHDALIEGGPAGAPPLPLAIMLALGSWVLMVTAMMLPASLPAIRRFERASWSLARPRAALAGFMASFGLGWLGFGLLAFGGDAVLHAIVDATPWLAARPWLVQAAVLALAGIYQLTPLKERSLAACRHRELRPSGEARERSAGLADVRRGMDAGWAHLRDCLGASGALMLLMFAAGFASLLWMIGLTAVMLVEAGSRRGPAASRLVAVALVVLAVATLAG